LDLDPAKIRELSDMIYLDLLDLLKDIKHKKYKDRTEIECDGKSLSKDDLLDIFNSITYISNRPKFKIRPIFDANVREETEEDSDKPQFCRERNLADIVFGLFLCQNRKFLGILRNINPYRR
jgi:hypothetical protein